MLQLLHRLWYGFRYPNLSLDGRRLTGIMLIMAGILRHISDPIRPLRYMPDAFYGTAAIIIGAALVLTARPAWHRRLFSRLVALAGAALLWAWAFDLGLRATVFAPFTMLGFVLFRETLRGLGRRT